MSSATSRCATCATSAGCSRPTRSAPCSRRMTPSSARSWSSTVASLRKASDGCLAGGREAFGHFEQYVNLLFCLTVAHKDAAIRLSHPAATSNVWGLTGGHDPRGGPAIRLTDGRYLRLVAWLEPVSY